MAQRKLLQPWGIIFIFGSCKREASNLIFLGLIYLLHLVVVRVVNSDFYGVFILVLVSLFETDGLGVSRAYEVSPGKDQEEGNP